MKLLFLCEGHADSVSASPHICKSLVDQLRADGHTVEVGDVALRGFDRYLAAAATFSPHRHRWGTRYHLSTLPFRLRSRRADRLVAARGQGLDAIVQVGATFQVHPTHGTPYFLCCDSNIRM